MPRYLLSLVPAVALALPLLSACGHRGDLDRLDMQFKGLANSNFEFESGDRLLVDTRICPTIVAVVTGEDTVDWLGESKGANYRMMFDESVIGPGSLDDDGCIALDQAGEVVWELNTEGEVFEQFRFTAVDVDTTTQLGFDRWQTRTIHSAESVLGEEYELVGLAPDRGIDELLIAPDTPRYVFANSVDVPMFRLDDADGRVYYTDETLAFEVEGDGFELVQPMEIGDEFEPDERLFPGELAFRFEAGGSAKVRTTLPNGEVRESPEMIAVDLSDAASLDLMQVADSYLFADVRDADGRPIHAAPITWEVVEGGLAIEPGNLVGSLRSSEYATVGTYCQAPPTDEPERRQATVRARLGELEDTVVIEWTAEPPDEDRGPWEAPEECQYAPADEESGGCSCSTEPRAPAGWSVLGFGLLVALRRRRSGRGRVHEKH